MCDFVGQLWSVYGYWQGLFGMYLFGCGQVYGDLMGFVVYWYMYYFYCVGWGDFVWCIVVVEYQGGDVDVVVFLFCCYWDVEGVVWFGIDVLYVEYFVVFYYQYIFVGVWWGDGDVYGVIGFVGGFVQGQFDFVGMCIQIVVVVILVLVGMEWVVVGQVGGWIEYVQLVFVLFYWEIDCGGGCVGIEGVGFFVFEVVGEVVVLVVVVEVLVVVVQFVYQCGFQVFGWLCFVGCIYVYQFEVCVVVGVGVVFGFE